MSLSSALSTAQNSLSRLTRQTSVVSRNVANASNENYTRRDAIATASPNGNYDITYRRATNDQLESVRSQAITSNAGHSFVAQQASYLNSMINGPEGVNALSGLVSELNTALQTYSSQPSNTLLGDTAVDKARLTVNRLNEASDNVQAFRLQMDNQIGEAVDELRGYLTEFGDANKDVLESLPGSNERLDAEDRRDALIKDISSLVSVNAVPQNNGALMLVTNDGAILFEKEPRPISFEPTSGFNAGTIGNPVRIDGSPSSAATHFNSPQGGGKISAMIHMRDDVGLKAQAELDETARGLMETFTEDSGDLGLFTAQLSASEQAEYDDKHVVPGLGSKIKINAAYDPDQGGNVTLLRDGGPGAPLNPTGAPSYSGRLIELTEDMSKPIAFDGQIQVTNSSNLSLTPNSGTVDLIGGSMSIMDFTTQTQGWLDGVKSSSTEQANRQEALYVQINEQYSNETGVNIDDELTKLVQLEHSYQASARIISVVDEMLAALMAAVR